MCFLSNGDSGVEYRYLATSPIYWAIYTQYIFICLVYFITEQSMHNIYTLVSLVYLDNEAIYTQYTLVSLEYLDTEQSIHNIPWLV